MAEPAAPAPPSSTPYAPPDPDPWAWVNTDTGERQPVALAPLGEDLADSRASAARRGLWLLRPESLELPEHVALHDGEAVIGRAAPLGASVVVGHSTISRRHATLTWSKARGTHGLVDLGSHNGTFLRGVRLRMGAPSVWLEHGDIVRLGDVVYCYERADHAAANVQADHAWILDALPGRSAAAARLRAEVLAVARDPSPVLLTGETGSGKEHVARAIHDASGRVGPFVAINCATLTASLLESLLFGHEAGSFTGASRRTSGLFREAAGGTVLLDEIGELPLEVQPKLLRVLQDRRIRALGSVHEVPVDVRVLTATHRDLDAMVGEKAFRRDLLARISMLEIEVPPLRARRPDLVQWWRLLERRWATERGQAVIPGQAATPPELGVGADLPFSAARVLPVDLSADVVEALALMGWPTNLRGLDAAMRRFAIRVGRTRPMGLHDLADLRLPSNEEPGEVESHGLPTPLQQPLPGSVEISTTPRRKAPERQHLVERLRTNGSVRATAKELGRDRRQIYRWIESFAIDDAEWCGTAASAD